MEVQSKYGCRGATSRAAYVRFSIGTVAVRHAIDVRSAEVIASKRTSRDVSFEMKAGIWLCQLLGRNCGIEDVRRVSALAAESTAQSWISPL